MNTDQCTELVAGLKRAKRAPKPYGWFFCMKGGDGLPVLLVGKRASEVRQEGKEVRKGAADKRGCRGLLVVGDDGRLVFGIDEGNATSDVVQRQIRMKLAVDPAVKAVKGLLQKARVLEAEAFAELFQVADEEEQEEGGPDAAKLQAKLDAARVESKKAYDAAVGRVGGKHADLVALVSLQESAKKERQDALALLEKDPEAAARKLKVAASRYEELAEAAAAAGLEDEADEAESEEEEAPAATTRRPPADPAVLAATYADAMEAVGQQLEALRKALFATGDPDLRRIGELGLSAMTAGQRTKLQTALMEARTAAPDARAAAIVKVAEAAGAFLDHLEHEVFDVCDENPFGVKVTVRKTLGGALRKLAAAA